MRHFVSVILVAALVASLGTNRAQADDDLDLTLDPTLVPAQALSYEEYRLQELERAAKRSRNALIGTAAAAAVGLALVIPATSTQCQSSDVDGKSGYDCSRAGNALIGVGSPLVIGGLTGALVSGIILGVRKGKLRRLNDSFGPSKARAVQWDERSSRFVF
jgi:hypothetical protein